MSRIVFIFQVCLLGSLFSVIDLLAHPLVLSKEGDDRKWAYRFDGESSIDLDFGGSKPWSYGLRIRADGDQNGYQVLVGKMGVTDSNGFGLYLSEGNLVAKAGDKVSVSVPFGAGSWKHIFVSSSVEPKTEGPNPGTLKLYIDGVLAGEASGNILAPETPWFIGCGQGGGDTPTKGAYFYGRAKDIRFYGRELGPTEISSINGNPLYQPSDALESLLAHYKCEEGTGHWALDASGKGKHARVWLTNEENFHYEGGDIPVSFMASEGFRRYDPIEARHGDLEHSVLIFRTSTTGDSPNIIKDIIPNQDIVKNGHRFRFDALGDRKARIRTVSVSEDNHVTNSGFAISMFRFDRPVYKWLSYRVYGFLDYLNEDQEQSISLRLSTPNPWGHKTPIVYGNSKLGEITHLSFDEKVYPAKQYDKSGYLSFFQARNGTLEDYSMWAVSPVRIPVNSIHSEDDALGNAIVFSVPVFTETTKRLRTIPVDSMMEIIPESSADKYLVSVTDSQGKELFYWMYLTVNSYSTSAL
ncbi:hypothetical protein FUAX_52800 (plasmid) [Fulvitalea axinellae]|uniref:LamG domain-containing protein n=1 Tax=Fulvitalea axinellae TaxID=1182444 RepID=A0AAU9DAB6_9BACT|nr:hypothetical protein FUAX_52800 [Fulvitalea axinellae]